MVFIYPPYRRSATSTHPLKATEALKTPPPQPNITTLPTPIIQLILTNLTIPDLTPLLNTSRLLRTHARTCISHRQQHHLEYLRSLQSLNPATHLPTELLQEILSYLDPLNFYNTTRVCSTWRAAASWPTLVRRNVYAVKPPGTVPPSGNSDGDIKTLAFYLQCNGQLCGGMEVEEMKKAVTTLYLKNPTPENLPGGTFPNDSGYEPGLGSKLQLYPEIHLSEDGDYFLSAETVFPFRVHVYCTYLPALAYYVRYKWFGPGPVNFNYWDTTPTYLLTLPETGRVVSASFEKGARGELELDAQVRICPPGVDLLVLFEGRQAQLYKIRLVRRRVRINHPPKRTFGERLSGLVKLTKAVVERKPTRGWTVWDSMAFKDVCPFQQGPTKVKLGRRSEKAFFAGPGGLEVWEGVSVMKVSENPKAVEVWDKDAAKKKLIPIISMPGKVCGIYTGRIWDSGVGADVDYIVCSNTIHDALDEHGEPQDRRLPIWRNSTLSPGQGTTKTVSEIACTTIITPTQSLVFNYTNFMQIPGTGVPQFVCLTPPYAISHLQLNSTLDTSNLSTDASGNALHKPFALRKKSELGYPSTSPFSKIIHIAAINVPFLLPSGPITVAATDSGIIYITPPPPCRYSGTVCANRPSCPCMSRLNNFRKVARIPPETGGRITDLKISYRVPKWANPARKFLPPTEYTVPEPVPGAMLVVVVATDRGRVEVCYFDFRNKRDGACLVENRLESAKAGRKWDLSGELVAPRA